MFSIDFRDHAGRIEEQHRVWPGGNLLTAVRAVRLDRPQTRGNVAAGRTSARSQPIRIDAQFRGVGANPAHRVARIGHAILGQRLVPGTHAVNPRSSRPSRGRPAVCNARRTGPANPASSRRRKRTPPRAGDLPPSTHPVSSPTASAPPRRRFCRSSPRRPGFWADILARREKPAEGGREEKPGGENAWTKSYPGDEKCNPSARQLARNPANREKHRRSLRVNHPPPWTLRRLTIAHEIKHESPLIGCRFDPSGQFVFAGSQDYKVWRWNLADGAKTELDTDAWVRSESLSSKAGKPW